MNTATGYDIGHPVAKPETTAGNRTSGLHPSSLAAQDPAILEIQNTITGETLSSQAAIGNDYGKAMALRMEARQSIAKGTPLYTCPTCGVPVYLVSRKDARKFFFRHLREDGRCSAQTRGKMSENEISARKYLGAKESLAHIQLKAIVAESLLCDPRFRNVQIESVLKGLDRTSWRKPDVQATYNGIPIAFEIQLSTTFLRVIAERRAFYQREGGLLVWIFKTFDTNCARLTQDDIFFSNNRNVFLASAETLEASRRAGKFMLDCRWAEPYFQDGELKTRWCGRLTKFDELEIDRERQRLFCYDYDREAQALQPAGDGKALRLEFETFWLSRSSGDPWDQDTWNVLRKKFNERGVRLPIEPNWGGAPAHLLNALYSAREGRAVGWRFGQLIQVALWVAAKHKNALRAFLHALNVYGRTEQIFLEDTEGKWPRLLKSCEPDLLANIPDQESERRFGGLVHFLFPELRIGDGHDI
ncbi:MAG: DUF6035 family protein [Thiobacillus sp.]